MAVWQYDLFLVREGQALPLLMNDGWELPQLPAASTLDAQEALAGSLGCPWLMMDDWVIFGNEERTRIDLMFNETDEVEIRIRLTASATGASLRLFAASLVSYVASSLTRQQVRCFNPISVRWPLLWLRPTQWRFPDLHELFYQDSQEPNWFAPSSASGRLRSFAARLLPAKSGHLRGKLAPVIREQ